MDELYQNLVRLSPKEQVPFRCIGCGACCKHVHMQVPVETLDAFRIVKHLQQQGEDIECMDDFWERYTEPALLNECGFFVYFLKTQGPEEACIFLQDNRCRIHTVNPRACRIYPLVVDPKENGRYEYLVSYERKQHFKGPKVHVKTWMKKRFGEEDRAFLTADFGSAKELAQLLRQIPDKRKKRALMCFHWAKYGNFDTGKPFLPQYERNLKVLREYLKIQYIFTNPGCGDNAETHTVREWLSEFGIPVEDEFFKLWHQKIFQLGSIFRKAEKVCSDHTMELAWSATFVELYLEYDTSKDFLPQFEENSEKILNLMKMIPTSKGGADRA